MTRVLVVCTVHRETGLANVSELQAILERIGPEVIFLELPSADGDRYLDGIRGTPESIAASRYRALHPVAVVPVDVPAPGDEFKRQVDTLFDSIEEVLCGAGAEEFLRGLMAWGVSEQEVLAYQGMVRAGKFLIVSHGSSAQVAKAHRILQANGALAWRIHGSPAGVLEGAGLRAGGSDEMADEGSLSLS